MNKLVESAITAALALIATNAAIAATTVEAAPNTEKCYGIAKAGMNDCQTANSSCAGSSVKNKQPDAFIFLPKGLCDRIVGGSTQPK